MHFLFKLSQKHDHVTLRWLKQSDFLVHVHVLVVFLSMYFFKIHTGTKGTETGKFPYHHLSENRVNNMFFSLLNHGVIKIIRLNYCGKELNWSTSYLCLGSELTSSFQTSVIKFFIKKYNYSYYDIEIRCRCQCQDDNVKISKSLLMSLSFWCLLI